MIVWNFQWNYQYYMVELYIYIYGISNDHCSYHDISELPSPRCPGYFLMFVARRTGRKGGVKEMSEKRGFSHGHAMDKKHQST